MSKSLLLFAACALALDGSSRNKMKVVFGDLITAGAGSAGGHTYSRNKGGAYRKNRPVPLQPNTAKQVQVRMNLGSLSAGWRDLSDDQRSAWNQAAKNVKLINSLGRPYQPTGSNYYVALNALIMQINFLQDGNPLGVITTPIALISDPPSFFSPNNFAMSNLNFNSSGNVNLDVDSDYTGSGEIYGEFYATEPLSAGITNPGNRFKLIKFDRFVSGTNPESLDAAYAATFGLPMTGKRIFIQLIPIDPLTGQQGLPITASSIVLP